MFKKLRHKFKIWATFFIRGMILIFKLIIFIIFKASSLNLINLATTSTNQTGLFFLFFLKIIKRRNFNIMFLLQYFLNSQANSKIQKY